MKAFEFGRSRGNTPADNMTIHEHLVCCILSGGVVTYRPAGLWQWVKWAFGKRYSSSMVDHKYAACNAVALADAVVAELDRRGV